MGKCVTCANKQGIEEVYTETDVCLVMAYLDNSLSAMQ